MPIKRAPHQPLYRAIDSSDGRILLRFRAKDLPQARARVRKELAVIWKRDPAFEADLYRFDGDWRSIDTVSSQLTRKEEIQKILESQP